MYPEFVMSWKNGLKHQRTSSDTRRVEAEDMKQVGHLRIFDAPRGQEVHDLHVSWLEKA